jgi:plastocyanin
MFRKTMLGMYLAAMVLFFPSTALAKSQPIQPTRPAQASGNTVEATEQGGGAQMVFVPADITVKTGDHVTFKNTGKVPHTATADDGSFDKTPLNPGESYDTPAFTRPGTFGYKCTYHASLGMVGRITVTGAATGGGATSTGGASPSASPSSSASGSPTPKLTGAAQFGISPSPAPTAPPSEKYFPKIAGAVVVLALIAIALGYVKTARKLADKS